MAKTRTRAQIKAALIKECEELGAKDKAQVFICDRQYQTLSPKFQRVIEGEVFNFRYCKKYSSIFIEDQPEEKDVVLNAINIDDFVLMTRSSDVMLNTFLMLNPANKANGGNLFYLENKEQEAKDKYDFYEKTDAAIKLGRDSSLEAVKAALFCITGADTMDMSSTECRLELRRKADENPIMVINAFEKEDTEIKYKYHTLVRLGHIIENPDSIEWSTGEVISPIMYGENACGVFLSKYIDKEKGEFIRTHTEELILK